MSKQKSGGGRQEAERRTQEAGGRRQEAGGRRQNAGGRRQEAGGRRGLLQGPSTNAPPRNHVASAFRRKNTATEAASRLPNTEASTGRIDFWSDLLDE